MQLHALEEKIISLPNEIYEREKKVLEAKEKYLIAKNKYDVFFALQMQQHQGTQSDKKAVATITSDGLKNALIRAETELSRHQAHLTSLNNQFTALRKVASIEIELVKPGLTGN